jgi:hypothetical protein
MIPTYCEVCVIPLGRVNVFKTRTPIANITVLFYFAEKQGRALAMMELLSKFNEIKL